MPVPTIGDSGSRSGTAWRCMFEPIRARFASSCSRNGISAVATETTCFGLTSMYSIWPARASGNVSRKRDGTRSARKWPSSSSGAFAWATTCSSSSSAGRYSMSAVTIGRIGKAFAFCFFSSAIGGGVERLAGLEDRVAALGQQVAAGLVLGQLRVVPGHGPLDPAVRRLDEAVAVDPAVGRERPDQADVRAFRASRSGRSGRSGCGGRRGRRTRPARGTGRPGRGR